MKKGIYILTTYTQHKDKFKEYESYYNAYLKDKCKCNETDTECLKEALLKHYNIIKDVVGDSDIELDSTATIKSFKAFLALYPTENDCPDELCKNILREYNNRINNIDTSLCKKCATKKIQNDMMSYVNLYLTNKN